MDGRTDGRTDGQTDGRSNGRTEKLSHIGAPLLTGFDTIAIQESIYP